MRSSNSDRRAAINSARSSRVVPDSAAGATAFSCLIKTYNGAIGVSPSKAPCGTILESAHRQGFSTGIVTTSRLTHATPASFYSHVVDRDLESEIAEFLVPPRAEGGGGGPQGQVVDLAFGGGKCFFLGNGTKSSCRTDGRDLLPPTASPGGLKVIEGMKGLRDWKDEEFDASSSGKGGQGGPVLGFFADDVSPSLLSAAS